MTEEELRLSVSKTKTFIDCKKKYEFSYIQKLPKKDWDFHIFGKFCHKVLEDFHNAYIINNSQESYNRVMTTAFKAAKEEFKDGMTSQMTKDCFDIISKYLHIVSTDKKNNVSANVIACEKKFDFEVSDKIILNGMIDRIQIDDDGVIHVCDYKTVKNKKYLKNDFFQLLTYAYVIVSENPEIDTVRASYILLRHDFEYITTEFKIPEIMTIKKKYEEYANQINTETIYKPNPTALCNFCDFLQLCPDGKTKSFSQNTYGEVKW